MRSPVFSGRGARLVNDKPASSRQFDNTLAEAAHHAGLAIHVTAHDVRRDVAKDMTNVSVAKIPV
jgi:site-specific recombinase XerC